MIKSIGLSSYLKELTEIDQKQYLGTDISYITKIEARKTNIE